MSCASPGTCPQMAGEDGDGEDAMTGNDAPDAAWDDYEIRVGGHLDRAWSEWFDGFTISYPADGETLLSGRVADQAALQGILSKSWDLGLSLLSLRRLDKGARE